MLKKLSAVLVLSLGVLHSAQACTGGQIKATDNSVVFGRTLEFAKNLNSDVIVIPRQFFLHASSPTNQPAMTWKSKYAAVGTNAENTPIIVDGLNEKGLAVGSFYFPGMAGYQEVSGDEVSKSLSSIDLGIWLLTNFATIDEVKEGLKQIKVSKAQFTPWNMTLPLHYIVTESSGKSIVIEYIKGEMHLYDNPIGVLTNTPGFDWHLMNLNNYINLSKKGVNGFDMGSLHLESTGAGSGMLGLPGDFTPPSRFVRIAFFTANAKPVDNAKGAVEALFHLLNNFDLPNGSVEEVTNGQPSYDVTQWTSVNDLANKRFYFKSRNNQNIQMLDLNQLDLDAKEIKKVTMGGETQVENLSDKAVAVQ